MANIKSKEKRRKQDDKKHLRNKTQKSKIKTAIKKAKLDPTEKNKNYAVKLIDQAVTLGLFHKNKSARLVAQIQKLETKKEN
ncbi:/ rpsT / 30S ribosomal protein S20 /:461834 Forward [Candidatus Hepatoplasma crinochetorum]|uniref:Small ribosomal subunit protein bS20 n=1 Tax=Candidatus Hepatoplasma crinochetorum TaxID=295596 RepID=A0A0G7ZMX0_9MOLU|nr:/ rpsT / 30S ribosomal protein S20 /:461834 Forward [Candidatus Hepatoplasma crinochetorum]